MIGVVDASQLARRYTSSLTLYLFLEVGNGSKEHTDTWNPASFITSHFVSCAISLPLLLLLLLMMLLFLWLMLEVMRVCHDSALTPWPHCSQEEPQRGAQCPLVTPPPPHPSPTTTTTHPLASRGGVRPACCGRPHGMPPPCLCLLTHFLPPLSLLFSSGHPYPSVLSVGQASRARVSL